MPSSNSSSEDITPADYFIGTDRSFVKMVIYNCIERVNNEHVKSPKTNIFSLKMPNARVAENKKNFLYMFSSFN